MFGLGKKNTGSPEKPGYETARGCTALVTGSSGLCGARLVEMLLERGAKHVICFDLMPPDTTLKQRFAEAEKKSKGKLTILSKSEGDLTNDKAVMAAFEKDSKIDVCFHIAALVGPFHDKEKYHAVNYEGTLNVIKACREKKVPKLVYSSSPSTRFTGGDITGQTEDELAIPDTFLALYAETKAMGEKAVTEACCDTLLTVSVAPHQVYGHYDSLFLPNLLETAGNGRLRIFGKGGNMISMCHADNYAHGLMCGADALYPGSPALAKFYIVTDGAPVDFWKTLNQAVVAMGFTDLYSKFHFPAWFLYTIAYAANIVGFLLNRKFKLNPFNVKMLTIHRYFSIRNAQRDLKYVPVRTFEEAWPDTIAWFKENWLPGFLERQRNSKKTD
jgi:nucleoside-diphosphate-sugar epimerase